MSGAFNIAAEPVLDATLISDVLGARPLRVSPAMMRAATWASWKLRLQPSSPGWLDMGMLSPVMSTVHAREQLGWQPRVSATQALQELLGGLCREEGISTPPLDPRQSGPLRVRELLTGVGWTDR